MFKYHVTEDRDGDDRFVLRDDIGRLYLVRALGAPPPFPARLFGARPHLGFGLLKCGASTRVYRVYFESTGSHAAIMQWQQQRTRLNATPPA